MEKHKLYLKQTSVGFAGVLTLMDNIHISDRLAKSSLELFKLTGLLLSFFVKTVLYHHLAHFA